MGDIKNKQNEDKSLKSPSSSLDNGNNPKGMASLKASRKTGEIPSGTAYLRGEQEGRNR